VSEQSTVEEATPAAAPVVEPPADMGTFAADGTYVPRQVIEDDLGGLSLDDAYTASMVQVEDGQIVEGTVVKVDRDEVLLDIGYKSEGVIPSRELSIRNDVDPSEIVSMGDVIEALVLQKEDKEGRLVLSKKRAQYERAWGTIEKIKEEDGVVSGPVIEVVKGGLIICQPQARREPSRCCVFSRELRCIRRPWRHGRPRPRFRVVLEAR